MPHKYIDLANTSNLEARLAKAYIEYSNSDNQEGTVKSPKSEKPSKKKRSTKEIINRICLVVLIVVVIFFIGISIINAQQQAERNEISKLQDARLISYENQIYEVKKLALLFAIYDDESYQRAKQNSNLSKELYSTYFVNEHYNKTETPVEIEYQDIQYEITENDYVSYLLYFKRKQGNTAKQYILQAEFADNTCIYFSVLN